MEHQLQAIVTVLSLVNPMICGAMFARIEAGQARAAQLVDAGKAALAVLVILVVAALVGARVLQVFGVLIARGGTRAPGGFLRDTATQFMGLIVVAMGVQFALTGVRAFFLEQP